MNEQAISRRDFLKTLGATAAVGLAAPLARAAAAPAGTPAKRPNILFCIADDASFPHMGAYGCKWVKTPAFDRVAREGVLFTQAYTPNAKCAPSRSCILTGRNSWQLEAAANHSPQFPAKFGLYTEALAAGGYHVGFTGKGWAPGEARTADGKPRQMTGKPWQRRKSPPPTTGISNCDYAANFKDFLAARPAGAPFCFWYGGFEPHRGYEYGSGVEKGGKKPGDVDHVYKYWPDNETVRTDMLDYAFEIEHFDCHLGRMLDLLEQRGELDSTLVIVTADNGMPFPRVKGQAYEQSNHLPLAMRWKNGIAGAGRTVDDFVSFIDFAPTFLEVAGIAEQNAKMQPITGRSLSDVFKAGGSGRVVAARDHVLIGKERTDVGRPRDEGYPIRAIVKDGWLYAINMAPERWPAGNPETGYLDIDGGPTKTEVIKARRDPKTIEYWRLSMGKRGNEELYHLAEDRDCMVNLAGRDEHRATLEKLKAQLMAELRAQGDPRVVGGGEKFDQYPYADPKQVHFYERYMSGEKMNAGWVSPTDFEKIEEK